MKNNDQASTIQHSTNELTNQERQLIFRLEGYGSVMNYTQKIVSIPWKLQIVPDVVSLSAKLKSFGWQTQIGIL